MERGINYVLLAALCFHMLTGSSHVYSYDFLSIACGAATGGTDDLGIKWVTDERYIQTGKSLRGLEDTFTYGSLRYFPEGRSKNCFVLPVKNTTTYLVRASFNPGNATTGPAVDLPVDFNITVNNNLLFSYSATAEFQPVGWVDSVVHTFKNEELFLCLLKGTEGSPFINGIELRELNTTAYYQVKEGIFFIGQGRYNTGTKKDDFTQVRYPDDIFDRIWSPTPLTDFPAFNRFENLSLTPPKVTAPEDGYNWPPATILQDAWVGRNLSSPNFPKPASVSLLYVGIYMDEIRSVEVSEANPVGVIIGVNNYSSPFNLTQADTAWTISITTDVSADSTINLTLTSQPWSNQSAILNGFELYSLQEVDTSATSPRDQDALTAIRQSFGLEDWTGDACYPVAWDWVKCNTATSRVTQLLLSKKNISGTIPEEIGQLTGLTEIHLDNNKLSGQIPDSLRYLVKLQILNLANNNLSGPVPASLQDKDGFTFTGNPGLCLTGNASCASPPRPPGPPPPSNSAPVKFLSGGFGRLGFLSVIVTLILVDLV
ncbi:hypothetical protein R1sor_020516 [Riccia sorocarpa]|uniref:Malectin-like domain-containing protein n=1 Tax=Riccia sorocarpa TaxID=122646 RepID=A0ABD3IIX9_9MARC